MPTACLGDQSGDVVRHRDPSRLRLTAKPLLGLRTDGRFARPWSPSFPTAFYPFIASTPPMISASSVVIWLWRARLYCMLRVLTILSALSVALFIATMRATCSLLLA